MCAQIKISLNFDVGLSCSDFGGIPMKANNQAFEHLINPHICCAKPCGSYCNECYPSVLEPSTCSITNDNMCYQDMTGLIEDTLNGTHLFVGCCANGIPHDRMCWGKTVASCRLRKQLQIYTLL